MKQKFSVCWKESYILPASEYKLNITAFRVKRATEERNATAKETIFEN